jgi:hypothetical protein
VHASSKPETRTLPVQPRLFIEMSSKTAVIGKDIDGGDIVARVF